MKGLPVVSYRNSVVMRFSHNYAVFMKTVLRGADQIFTISKALRIEEMRIRRIQTGAI